MMHKKTLNLSLELEKGDFVIFSHKQDSHISNELVSFSSKVYSFGIGICASYLFDQDDNAMYMFDLNLV